MTILATLILIAIALIAFWGWLLYTTPPKPCDDECQRECCAPADMPPRPSLLDRACYRLYLWLPYRLDGSLLASWLLERAARVAYAESQP